MRYFLVITAMLATSACHLGSAPPRLEIETEGTTVQNDVRRMSDALFDGNVSAIIDLLYPGLVERLGGTAVVRTMYEGVVAVQARSGVERESLTFPTAPEFIEGKDGRWFVLVPSHVVIFAKDARGAATGYHLGVKEAGATEWKYIPGPFIRPDQLPSLLPDFPSEHPLPPRSTEKLPSRSAAPTDS